MSQPIGRTIITASSAVTATRTGRERSSVRPLAVDAAKVPRCARDDRESVIRGGFRMRETARPHPEEARSAVSKGGQPALPLPTLRDASLRDAPQGEVVVSKRNALQGSYLEDPGILRLDLVGHLLDLDRILAHGLDRAERRPAGLGLDLQVGRILAAQVDEERLALARHD